MNVLLIPVKMEEHAQMELIHTAASVLLDTLDPTVKQVSAVNRICFRQQ